MPKPDDSTLSERQRQRIRQEALKALTQADAIGVFPTPIDRIMAVSKVELARDDLADETLLRSFRSRAKGAIKRAVEKIRGVVDIVARIVYLDQALHKAQLPFLKLHETAHAVLPWQKDLYAVTEDCGMTLDPEIAEVFEREASNFATEVIFQGDAFQSEAADYKFGIRAPLDLAKTYGSSVYMAVRRYVSTHHRACGVLVLEMPEVDQEFGFRCELRRFVSSPSFDTQFGSLYWPDFFTPSDQVGATVPATGKRMSGIRKIGLVDRNGTTHECVAEAFTTTKQVFILIHSQKTLTTTRVIAIM